AAQFGVDEPPVLDPVKTADQRHHDGDEPQAEHRQPDPRAWAVEEAGPGRFSAPTRGRLAGTSRGAGRHRGTKQCASRVSELRLDTEGTGGYFHFLSVPN